MGQTSAYLKEIEEDCNGEASSDYSKFSSIREYLFKSCQQHFLVNQNNPSVLNTISGKKGEGNTVYFNPICQAITEKSQPMFFDKDTGDPIIRDNDYTMRMDNILDTYSFTIGYSNLFENTIDEIYTDSFIEAIIDFIGLSGFWLGFSFITCLEFFTLAMIIVKSCCSNLSSRNRKRGRIIKIGSAPTVPEKGWDRNENLSKDAHGVLKGDSFV